MSQAVVQINHLRTQQKHLFLKRLIQSCRSSYSLLEFATQILALTKATENLLYKLESKPIEELVAQFPGADNGCIFQTTPDICASRAATSAPGESHNELYLNGSRTEHGSRGSSFFYHPSPSWHFTVLRL